MPASLVHAFSRLKNAVTGFIRADRFALIASAAVIAYGIVWSLISTAKLYTYHATVFDLGVSSYLLWSVFHGHFVVVPEKAIYLLLAPFYYIYPSQAALLTFQSFWIGSGALPLYLIAKRIVREREALMVSIAYLLYFPVAGINWFDFHFMALFPTLFFTGLYFRMTGRAGPSAIFLGLSCLTDALAPVVVTIAGCILLYEDCKIRIGKVTILPRDNTRISMRYDAAVAILPLLLMLAIAAAFGASTLLKYVPFSLSPGAEVTALSYDILWKLFFIVLPILPFVAFTRKSALFLLLSVPYSLFAIFSTDLNNFTPYYYQYAALYAPGYMLAALLGLAGMKERSLRISGICRIKVKPAALFVALVMISGAFLLPYSPANAILPKPPGGNYLFLHNVLPESVDNELTKMIALIPSNASVLMQNNMPLLAQRVNSTIPGVYKGNYLPDYVVTDPHSRFFYVNINGSTKGDMLYWVNSLFSTGRYGIMAEAGNCVLLAKDYTGPMQYFMPYTAKQSMPVEHGTDPAFQTYLANGLYELNLSGPNYATLLFRLNGTASGAGRSGTYLLSNGISVVISVERGSMYSFVSVAASGAASNTSFTLSLTQAAILQY